MKTTLLALALALGPAVPLAAQQQTPPPAIEYSDGYYTRLTVHRIGSYAMLPLFGAEYLLGHELEESGDVAGWVKPTHVAVATGIGALFVLNTVTGGMNLWEARHEQEGRTRRLLHAALLTLADAGFVYTATLAEDAGEEEPGEDGGGSNDHRNAALVSIGISTAGTLLMWLGNR